MLISPSQQQLKRLLILIFAGFLLLFLTAAIVFGYSQYRKVKQESRNLKSFTLQINQSAFSTAQKRIKNQ